MQIKLSKLILLLMAGTTVFLVPEIAVASESELSGANTAWILTATALVLFMTMPGLALFYCGLVQAKNVLSVMMRCTAIACLVSLLWLICAYSIASGDGGSANAFFGGFGKSFLISVTPDSLSGDIPETVFFMFQMTFAIITPALMVGAYPERMKFDAVLIFSGLWLVLVYAPVTHWVWGGGWLADMGIMDFAGGIVGSVLVAIFAMPALGGIGFGEGGSVTNPLYVQIVGLAAVIVWSGVISLILIKLTKTLVGLRVRKDEITEGLDLASHGENSYNL